LCIAEGFATGTTIHQATGYPVAVAFNTDNMGLVAKAMRQNCRGFRSSFVRTMMQTPKVIPALLKANHAALVVDGKVAVPNFGEHRPVGATNFNDMAALVGHEAVAKAIDGAVIADQSDNDGWPDPLPLTAKIDPEPYPLDALPETLRAAVEEVRPSPRHRPLVASSALAALSLAVQAHADEAGGKAARAYRAISADRRRFQ